MSEVNAAALVLLSLRQEPSSDSIGSSKSPHKRHRTPSYDSSSSSSQDYDSEYYPQKRILPPMNVGSPPSPPGNEMDMKDPDFQHYYPGRDVIKLNSRAANRPGSTPGVTKKSFGCESCGRAFARREHLFRHIETMHHGQKDFKCELCSRVFSRKDNMMQHVRNKHADEKVKEEDDS